MTKLTTSELEAMERRFKEAERAFAIAKARRSVAQNRTPLPNAPLGKGVVRIKSAQSYCDGLADQKKREASR